MRKTLISIVTISILAAPLVGLAAEIKLTDVYCEVKHDLSNYSVCCSTTTCLGAPGATKIVSPALEVGMGRPMTQCCLIDKVLTVGDYIFVAILIVAILVMLFAAWTFLTAAGSPDKTTKARNLLIYGVIGVVVAFLAGKVLVRVIAAIMA